MKAMPRKVQIEGGQTESGRRRMCAREVPRQPEHQALALNLTTWNLNSHTLRSQSGALSWQREHEDPFLSSLLFCQNMYLPNSHLFFVCFSNYSLPTSCSPISPSCCLSFPPPRSGFPVQFHILNIFSISHRLTIHVHTPYLPPPPSRSL